MAYLEWLAENIRELLADEPGISEKRMFGGLSFLLHGNMACGVVRELLMVRVGPDAYAEALVEPDAAEMDFTGRTMRGWVQVEAAVLDDSERLAAWVARGLRHARSLPPKAARPARAKSKKKKK